jgi:protein-tyrosine phosphatase
MSESRFQPERIDLTQADDPRDVVHRAVACLAQGGVVALSTETSIAFASSALQPPAVVRLRRLKEADDERALPLALKGPEELLDWVPDLSSIGERLVRRAWPGPVTFLVHGQIERGLAQYLPPEVRELVARNGAIGVRSPAHAIVQEILRLLPGPLVLTGSPFTRADELAARADVDLVVDSGPPPMAGKCTVVQLDGEQWQVVRPGVVPADELTRMAGTVVLFVCTGNTCRSPMAQALCGALLARRLHCAVDELPDRGFVVLSAGIGAVEGMPAAAHAAEVVRSRGGSLHEHASRRLTARLVRQADLIVAMTRDHRDAVQAMTPDAADRVRLLHARGADIDDPVGADRETYRRTAELIEEQLDALFTELGW